MKPPSRTLWMHLALLATLALSLRAQEPKATQWTVALSEPSPAIGREVEVIVTARIAPHWIVYSTDFKAELGPQPTQVIFDLDGSFELVGGIVSVAPKRKKDATWDVEFGYFETRAEFRQRIKVLKAGPVIAGRIKGQLCNERDGTCTLFEEKFGR
jgi:hypothetical protein